MRISDWSSDVCSSDLAGVGDLDLPAAVGVGLSGVDVLAGSRAHEDRYALNGLVVVALAGVLGVVQVASEDLDGLIGLLRASRGDAAEQQIGRASCRERVCQSV